MNNDKSMLEQLKVQVQDLENDNSDLQAENLRLRNQLGKSQDRYLHLKVAVAKK